MIKADTERQKELVVLRLKSGVHFMSGTPPKQFNEFYSVRFTGYKGNIDRLLGHWGNADATDYELSKKRDQTFFVPIRFYLPYGVYQCANGNEVLFNRDYMPMWGRDKTTKKVEALDNVYIVHDDLKHKHNMFFNDCTNPYRTPKTLDLCLKILDDWGVKDTMPEVAKQMMEMVKNHEMQPVLEMETITSIRYGE